MIADVFSPNPTIETKVRTWAADLRAIRTSRQQRNQAHFFISYGPRRNFLSLWSRPAEEQRRF
jgi:hypothetical protein